MDAAVPTLRALLSRPGLRLRLLSEGLPPDSLDRPLRWVHSSDLPDPTPFLADDLVLLTTGAQLAATPAAPYVARLAARGVLGLGFGAGVHREDPPDDLVNACAAHGIPLFEVPYGTPFIAVARAHAEAIAAAAYARRTWALEAQRALAIAALRGLDAALTELSRRLQTGVTMFDAAGALVHTHPASATGGELAAHAAALLARGATASETIEHEDTAYTLFTLGRTGRLRGVIGIAAAALDPEARTVVTSVIAMAGLALEQGEQISRQRRLLDAEVLTLLRGGAVAAAARVRSLPSAPVVIAVADAPAAASAQWWATRAPAALVTESDDRVVMLLPASAAAALDAYADALGVRVGVSERVPYDGVERARAQAFAAERRPGAGAQRYAASGIRHLLGGDDARLAAETRLAPLRAADPGLVDTLRVWLEHDARVEQAADALGIHRHTLRARIAQASSLLGADLAAFPARAELWTMLQALE